MPTSSTSGLHWGCTVKVNGPKNSTSPMTAQGQQANAVVSGPGITGSVELSVAQNEPCFGMKPLPCSPNPEPDLG